MCSSGCSRSSPPRRARASRPRRCCARGRGSGGGGVLLPANWYRRFDAALAATGNRIGVPHLAIAGIIPAVVVIGLGLRLLALNPVVAAALGAAAALASAMGRSRFAQTRYQNRFLNAFPDALDLIGRAVRAGLPVLDAMEVASREIRYPSASNSARSWTRCTSAARSKRRCSTRPTASACPISASSSSPSVCSGAPAAISPRPSAI